MGSFRLLFTVEVVHGYFGGSAGGCRLSFEPDADSRAWLSGAGCVLRTSPDTLQVFYEAADGPGTRRLSPSTSLGAVPLRFDVRSDDPEFSLYTDCAADVDTIVEGRTGSDVSAPGVTILEAGVGAPTRAPPSISGRSTPTPPIFDPNGTAGPRPAAGLRGRPNFAVAVTVTAVPADDGQAPVHTVTLNSRLVTWKYLFSKDWPTATLEVFDSAPPTSQAANGGVFGAAGITLADGGGGTAYRSPYPIALAQRSDKRIQLRLAAEPDTILNPCLPATAPAGLTLETPGDPSSLVCEIFVPF